MARQVQKLGGGELAGRSQRFHEQSRQLEGDPERGASSSDGQGGCRCGERRAIDQGQGVPTTEPQGAEPGPLEGNASGESFLAEERLTLTAERPGGMRQGSEIPTGSDRSPLRNGRGEARSQRSREDVEDLGADPGMTLSECPGPGENHGPGDARGENVSLPGAQMIEEPDPVDLGVGRGGVGDQRAEPRGEPIDWLSACSVGPDELSASGDCGARAVGQSHIERLCGGLDVGRGQRALSVQDQAVGVGRGCHEDAKSSSARRRDTLPEAVVQAAQKLSGMLRGAR